MHWNNLACTNLLLPIELFSMCFLKEIDWGFANAASMRGAWCERRGLAFDEI